jgi:APA family basic amino acid/polyamine antiporter
MALDGLFFKPAGKLDPVHRTPAVSLVVQCVWACLLTLTGTYSNLLDYVIFAVLLFYMLTIAGLRLARKPDAEPLPRSGLPVLPALHQFCGADRMLLLLYKPATPGRGWHRAAGGSCVLPVPGRAATVLCYKEAEPGDDQPLEPH